MDAIKEYVSWRELPRDLAVRIRRYYEHYYTRQAVFDEKSILGELNPYLRSEVVEHVLLGTLGRIPLCARRRRPLAPSLPRARTHEFFAHGKGRDAVAARARAGDIL